MSRRQGGNNGRGGPLIPEGGAPSAMARRGRGLPCRSTPFTIGRQQTESKRRTSSRQDQGNRSQLLHSASRRSSRRSHRGDLRAGRESCVRARPGPHFAVGFSGADIPALTQRARFLARVSDTGGGRHRLRLERRRGRRGRRRGQDAAAGVDAASGNDAALGNDAAVESDAPASASPDSRSGCPSTAGSRRPVPCRRRFLQLRWRHLLRRRVHLHDGRNMANPVCHLRLQRPGARRGRPVWRADVPSGNELLRAARMWLLYTEWERRPMRARMRCGLRRRRRLPGVVHDVHRLQLVSAESLRRLVVQRRDLPVHGLVRFLGRSEKGQPCSD